MFVLGISHNTFPLWFFFWRGGVYHTICFLFFHCHLMYLTHLPTQTAHFALHNPPQLVLPHSSIKPTMLNTALLPPYQMPSFWTTPFKIPEYAPPQAPCHVSPSRPGSFYLSPRLFGQLPNSCIRKPSTPMQISQAKVSF